MIYNIFYHNIKKEKIYNIKVDKSIHYAFTLAETMIVLVILGIVAGITIPVLLNKYVEKSNRTKVKKAMTAYESIFNKIIIENNIKTDSQLTTWANSDCANTAQYFKEINFINNNLCKFKTSDNVYWDISNIENPIIILKNDTLNDTEANIRLKAKDISNNTVFGMVGRFDNANGSTRINDYKYEMTNGDDNQKKYVQKLWYYITQSTSILDGFQKCKAEKQNKCTININGEDIEYTAVSINGNLNYIRKIEKATTENATDEKNCKTSANYDKCKELGDYWNLAKETCNAQGTRLPNKDELKILYNQGDIKTGWADNGACGSGGNTWCAIMLYHNGNVTTNGKNGNPQYICIDN